MTIRVRLTHRAGTLRDCSKGGNCSKTRLRNKKKVGRRSCGPTNRPLPLTGRREHNLNFNFDNLLAHCHYGDSMDCSGKIMECVKKENISEAEEAFGSMAKKGVNLNIGVYKAMIKGHSQARNTNRILKLFDEMQDRGLKRDADVFNAAIQSWSIDEDINELLALFERMKSEYRLIPDPSTYDHLLEKCAEAKDSEAARKVFKEMLSSGVNTYSTMLYTMIKTYSRCCTEDTAAQYLEDCRALIKWKRRIAVNPSKATYKMVLNICVQGGLAQEAVDLLNEMMHENMQLDTETMHIALQACAKAGDLDNVLHLLDQTNTRFWCMTNEQTYTLVLKACAFKKDFKTAKCIFEEMCDSGVRSSIKVLNTILDVYADCCDANNGKECFTESKEVLNKMEDKGVQPDLKAYNTILKTCARSGLTNEALSILKEMKTKDFSANIVSYGTIISGLSKDESLSKERIQALSMELLEEIKKEEI